MNISPKPWITLMFIAIMIFNGLSSDQSHECFSSCHREKGLIAISPLF